MRQVGHELPATGPPREHVLDREDDPGLLGDRNEGGGHAQAVARMIPPEQRLGRGSVLGRVDAKATEDPSPGGESREFAQWLVADPFPNGRLLVAHKNVGHYGHLMTEAVSRLWGWPRAKAILMPR